MNASLTRTLLLTVAVAATGAMLTTVLSGSPAPLHGHTVLAAAPAATRQEAIVVLPTVHVVPEVAPILLATVTVRPDGASGSDDLTDLAASIDDSAGAGGGTGMPYYSFGKSMHRAYWE